MVSLKTNAPELAGEIAEEIRLFIDERRIEDAEEAQEGYFLTQTSEEKDGFYSRAVLFVDGEKVSEGSCALELTAKSELEFKKYKKLERRCLFLTPSLFFGYAQRKQPIRVLTP